MLGPMRCKEASFEMISNRMLDAREKVSVFNGKQKFATILRYVGDVNNKLELLSIPVPTTGGGMQFGHVLQRQGKQSHIDLL